MKSKALSLVLSLCLVLSLFPAVSFAETETGSVTSEVSFSDVQGHWAREAIQKAVNDGYVKGYPGGTFAPEKAVSRAEFVSMVNNALQLRAQNKVAINFSDVKESDWYYEEVAKAGYVRYAKGTSETEFSPEDVITRQEAAVMLSRFLPKLGMTGTEVLDNYPDRAGIEAWAEEGMAITINKGYMKGHANGQLAPLETLTRAEAVSLIGQILAGETIVREDVFVKESGDILSDKIYVGDITIAEEVGEGDATLQNLSALSVVYVKGGGSHTVTMENSLIIRLVVTKEGTQVRVLAGDGTSIYTSIMFNNNLLVDENGEDAEPDGETFEDIVVVQGTVTQEQAQNIAAAISGQIQSGGQITQQQVAQAVLSILPNGNANTNQAGTIVVEVPATPPENSGGGGNRRPSTSVTVTGEADYITATVAAVTAPADAVYTYQWSRSDAQNGVYTDIETATGAAFTIAEEDIGCFLKVTATGTEVYSGTVVSRVIGPVGFDGGAGTEASPFEIANWYHLDNMRYQLDKSFILTEDLDGIGVGYDDVIESRPEGWEPVGQYPNMIHSASNEGVHASGSDPSDVLFMGTFDGNGKTIQSLLVNNNFLMASGYDDPSPYSTGLFGTVYRAEIRDLTLLDAYVSGTDYVGALAGYSRESTISGITCENSPSYRSVEASGRMLGVYGQDSVGGIVGRNDLSIIEDCKNSTYVNGRDYVGGITGTNYVESGVAVRELSPEPEYTSTVSHCVNDGTVYGINCIGGIVGGNGYSYPSAESEYIHATDTPAYISQCINEGIVEAEGAMPLAYISSEKIGGIVGVSTGTVSECVNTGSVSVYGDEVGGIAGFTNGIVENCYNEGTVQGGEAFGGIAGFAREAKIRFNYNIGEVGPIVPYDALLRRTPYEICGYDEGEWSEFYEPSSFSANIYLMSMDLAALADAKAIRPMGIYGARQEEMRNPLTYKDQLIDLKSIAQTEWDFETIWAMNLQDNNGLPFLRWQIEDSNFNRPVTLEVTMPTPAAITYGQTLAEATLTGGTVTIDDEEIAGTFSYWNIYFDPVTYEPWPDSETALVIFNPTDLSYLLFVGKVEVPVNRLATVLVTPPTAGAITIGSPLSNSTLSGGVVTYEGTPVPGTFYFDNSGFVPQSLGTYTAAVTFQPNDWVYDTVSAEVEVAVIADPGPLSIEAPGESVDQ